MAGGASSSFPPTEESKRNLLKQVRSHEVAIAELNNLPSSRTVYQQDGTIFFRTSIKKASESEQRHLDLAKTELQKMNST